MSCTCNEPKTETLTCFREQCSNTLTREVSSFEKMSYCPTHRYSIAICSPRMPYLCDSCRANNYYMGQDSDRTGWYGFGPRYIVKNLDVDGPKGHWDC